MQKVLADVALSDFVGASIETISKPPNRILQEILHAIRKHLDMDVAFVSEFTDGRRVFRFVDAMLQDQPVKVGGSNSLEESYCQRIVDGRLPELIIDASAVPAAMELPVTAALPVGAHLGVPIRLMDGSIYGTLCCFSFTPDITLNERDLVVIRMFADLAARQREQRKAGKRGKDQGCTWRRCPGDCVSTHL